MDTAEHQLSPTVERFRQVVLWPVQLMPRDESIQIQSHWEHLTASGRACVWKEVADEFTGEDPSQFSERHYKEFVTFLPYVQRFLYGEGIGADGGDGYGGSPIRVFRRHDVSQARITFPGDPQPVVFDIAHVDLYFFYDIDIAILVVEIAGEKLPLRSGPGGLVSIRACLSHPLGTQRPRRALRGTGRMAVPRRHGAGRFRLREQGALSSLRLRAPRAVRGLPLGVPDAAAGAAPCRRGRPDPLPGDRVSAHAADELPGVRRYDEADARGSRAPGLGDPARQFADAAVLRVLPAGLRDPLLLRPLLGERARARLERHALHLQRPRVHRDRRCGGAFLHGLGQGRPGSVSASVLPAVPDRAFSQGGPADALRPAGHRHQPPGYPAAGIGTRLQEKHPAHLGDLPALHPPLLVPGRLRPGPGAGSVRDVEAPSRHSGVCTSRRDGGSWT